MLKPSSRLNKTWREFEWRSWCRVEVRDKVLESCLLCFEVHEIIITIITHHMCIIINRVDGRQQQ